MNLTAFARSTGAVLTTLVVCPLLAAVSCERTAQACDVSFDGLHVVGGEVVDAARPVCDQPPQTHFAKVAIEFSVGGEWIELGRPVSVAQIPDVTGFPIEVKAPCQEGTYRTTYRAEGVGPAPTGTPFSFTDTSAEVTFALVECAS